MRKHIHLGRSVWMLILLKHFQNRSGFDHEHDKTYTCMFSSMFLIKNHQQGHSLKSQYKNLKFARDIRKSIINNK